MKVKKYYLSGSLNETKSIALSIVNEFIKGKRKCIVFLDGSLGSGKTTFVRFALQNLGVDENKFNGSPSFTLINEYNHNIYHIDLYRISSEKEAENIGIYEYLKNDGIFFIEWPEILNVKPCLVIKFKIKCTNRRKIYVYSS